MRPTQSPTIHLSDYTPPAFLVSTVDLHFKLDPKATRVQSWVVFEGNDERTDGPHDLRLDGRALKLISEIDAMGGSVEAIERGFIQREIHRSAMQWQREVERGERTIVGVNDYKTDEPPPEIFRADDSAREQVLHDLDAIRKERDDDAVRASLGAIERAAKDGTNLMHPILEAVDRYATLGEVCGLLEGLFGKYRGPEGF